MLHIFQDGGHTRHCTGLIPGSFPKGQAVRAAIMFPAHELGVPGCRLRQGARHSGSAAADA